ncbi:MAG: hypothetical protein ACYTEL_16280 [Planctomycetota bacterium]|jgi:hypothetical protein
MSKKENKPRNKEPIELTLAIVCLIVFMLGAIFLPAVDGHRHRAILRLLFLLGLPYLLISLILALVALRKIIRTKGALALKIVAVVIILSSAALVAGWFYFWSTKPFRPAYRVICGANIKGLGMCIVVYANDNNGKYPARETWCDLLIQGDLAEKRLFKCPARRESECTYAINPNCEPNSPGDTVLLFETKGGWNQSGGLEILTTQNQYGNGCNVLFNDGTVKFVNTEELNKLQW